MNEFTLELRDVRCEQTPFADPIPDQARHEQAKRVAKSPFAKLPNAVTRDREIDPAELVFLTWRATFVEWTCAEAAILAANLVAPNTGFGKNAIRAAMSRAGQHGFLTRAQANPGHFNTVVETFMFPPSGDGYTEIPRAWFDGALSLKAMAARIFLAAGTGSGPKTYSRELRARFGWKTATANKVLKELRMHGLSEMLPVRTSHGQFDGEVHCLKARTGDQKPGIGKFHAGDQKSGDGKPGDEISGNVQRLSSLRRISKDKNTPSTKRTPAAVNSGGDDLSKFDLKTRDCNKSPKPSETKPSRAGHARRPQLADCEHKLLEDHFEDFMHVYPFPDKSGWYEQSRAEFQRIVFAESAAEGSYFVEMAARILDATIVYRNKEPKCPRNPYLWLKNKGYLHVDSVEDRVESTVERRARYLGLSPKKETNLERRARLMGLTPRPSQENDAQKLMRLMKDLRAKQAKKSSFEEIMDVLNGNEEL